MNILEMMKMFRVSYLIDQISTYCSQSADEQLCDQPELLYADAYNAALEFLIDEIKGRLDDKT
jgi:hypothetical protein